MSRITFYRFLIFFNRLIILLNGQKLSSLRRQEFSCQPTGCTSYILATFQEWGKEMWGKASVETGFQRQIREHTGSSRETYVWTRAKNLASLRSVGWQTSCSGNSRLKSGGGETPSAHAEGKCCNIYLAVFNSGQLGFGESCQNGPLKTVKSLTFCVLVSLSLHSPPLYQIFRKMVNYTSVSKP